MAIFKWYRRYKFFKTLGINHPLKASLDKKFCGGCIIMLACQHCGASLEGYNDVVQATQYEICDDKAIITTDYRCPICLGWTRGTQIGYIKEWEYEQLEAV